MNAQTRDAVRRVLRDVVNDPSFFDQNDAEKINAMIARGYQLGLIAAQRLSKLQKIIKPRRER